MVAGLLTFPEIRLAILVSAMCWLLFPKAKVQGLQPSVVGWMPQRLGLGLGRKNADGKIEVVSLSSGRTGKESIGFIG